jgi:phosphonate transport system substrate-binding protein
MKKQGFGSLPLIILALVLPVLTACDAPKNNAMTDGTWPAKVVMGFLPNEESNEDNKKSNIIMQTKMSEYLGIPVEIVIASDYNAVIETMRNKKIEVAYFGPFSYVIASERSGAEAIAVMAKEGKPENAFYSAVFITYPGSGIKSLADVRGRKKAFVDPASTSGNLVPRAMYVREFNIEPDKLDSAFASVQFSGSHNNSLMAVANRSVEAAVVTRLTFEDGLAKGLIKAGEVEIFAESDPIANSPVAVRGDLPADLKAKIASFFLEWDNVEYFAMRKREGYRYIPVQDESFNPIRDIAKAMRLTPEDLLK